jgi:hypothetical protein
MDYPRPTSPLDRRTILKALSLLNEKFEEESVIGEICLFGGTVMMLAFNARLSTGDVDAVFQPAEVFRRRAREVAEEMQLSEDWLNDGVKGYVSNAPEYTSDGLPQMSNLRVIRPTAEYLLAMKCIAARMPSYTTKGDRHDIVFLMNYLGLETVEAVLMAVEKFYSSEHILPKTQFLIRELVEEGRGSDPKLGGPPTDTNPRP